MYCNRPCLWRTGGWCGSVTTITRNCVHRFDPHQTGFVSKGSDHLQLIRYWPCRVPGKGVCGGAKKFWLHLTTASVQCLHTSEHIFHISKPWLGDYSRLVICMSCPTSKWSGDGGAGGRSCDSSRGNCSSGKMQRGTSYINNNNNNTTMIISMAP